MAAYLLLYTRHWGAFVLWVPFLGGVYAGVDSLAQ